MPCGSPGHKFLLWGGLNLLLFCQQGLFLLLWQGFLFLWRRSLGNEGFSLVLVLVWEEVDLLVSYWLRGGGLGVTNLEVVSHSVG